MPILSLLVNHFLVIYEVTAGVTSLGNGLSAHSLSLCSQQGLRCCDHVIQSGGKREKLQKINTFCSWASTWVYWIWDESRHPCKSKPAQVKRNRFFHRVKTKVEGENGKKQKGYMLQSCKEEPFRKQKGQVFWAVSSANAGQQMIFERKDGERFIDTSTKTWQIMKRDARELQ